MVGKFLFAGVSCGLKKNDSLDLALAYHPDPCLVSALYTTSSVKAAPVLLGRKVTDRGRFRALVVNSGNANACTGKPGFEAVEATQAAAAESLSIESGDVLVSSTGVIGVRLPVGKVVEGLKKASEKLSPDGLLDFAKAIMTTDCEPKTVQRTVDIEGKAVTLLGVIKGAGMIMPNMATLLCYIFSDVAAGKEYLDTVFKKTADATLNAISVDGDQSTNDTAAIFTDGTAGNRTIEDPSSLSGEAFAAALKEVLSELAYLVVADGEGAGHVIEITVEGAASDADAMLAARAVGNSSLVKTAFYGEDPNWGRIAMALGNSGAKIDPEKLGVVIGDQLMVQNGLEEDFDFEAVGAAMSKKKVPLRIDLGLGRGRAFFLASDLGVEYVKLNAHYRT